MQIRYTALFVILISISIFAPRLGRTADSQDFVTIQSVSTKQEYLMGNVRIGSRIYMDRGYVIQDVPQGLLDSRFIKASNDDDFASAKDHLKLRLQKQATMYVGWDQRSFRPAKWLRGWQRVNGQIETDDAKFDLYRKTFAPGLVTLGGNSRGNTGASSHYIVIVLAGSGNHGLESGGIVNDSVLAVERPKSDRHRDVDRRPGFKIRPPTRAPIVPTGFEVKLFAREPMVRNPCAMCFDAKGRMVIGYGPQYRNPRPETPGDMVAILLDDNDDGVADRQHVFAEGFNCIQGLAWNGKELWVANAPDLTMVKDVDGDDVADEYVRVYTDLGNLEHGLHGLQWAPDGKLYMSKGNSKGHNRPHEDGRVAPRPFRDLFGLEHPINAPDFPKPATFTKDTYFGEGKGYHDPADDWGRQGGVLRCGSVGKDLEIVAQGFRNPWDIAFDDEFCFLGTDNDQDQGDKIFTPFFGAHFGWGHAWSYQWNHAEHTPTVPASAPLFEGSGTGVAFYSATQFPPHLQNVFFVNDWLRQSTFVYRSAWDGAWRKPANGDGLQPFAIQAPGGHYKPTDLEVGPDGALYVNSWGVEYGAEWKPGEVHQTQLNEGRIYRISYKENPLPQRADWYSPKRDTSITKWSFRELVVDLDRNSLPVWRVNAQNELVRRGDEVAEKIMELIGDPKQTAMLRTWAIWVFARASLQNHRVDQFLSSIHGRTTTKDRFVDTNLRIQSLRIMAERCRHPDSKNKGLPRSMHRPIQDPDARIRFESVQAVWRTKDSSFLDQVKELTANETDPITFYTAWNALRDLATVSERKAMLNDDRAGVRFAALLGLMDDFLLTKEEVFERVYQESDPRVQEWGLKWILAGRPPRTVSNQKERVASKDNLNVEDVLAQLASAKSERVRRALLTLLTRVDLRDNDLKRIRKIYDAGKSRGESATSDEQVLLLQILTGDVESYPRLWDALRSADEKISAAAMNALADDQKSHDFLVDKLTAVSDAQSYVLAIRSLAKQSSLAGQVELKAGALAHLEAVYWKSTDPRLKSDVLSILARIRPDSLSPAGQTKMKKLAHAAARDTDPRVYGLAAQLAAKFGVLVTLPKQQLVTVDDVIPLLDNADATRGQQIFFDKQRANCLNCHQIENRGTNFAPTLSDIGHRATPQEITESILHPSKKITEGFAVTNIITDAGRVRSGVVKSETDSSVFLFQTDGRQVEVPKNAIEERVLSQSSLMPANFGLLLAKQEIADIVAWLMTKRARVSGVATIPVSLALQQVSNDKATIEFSTLPGKVVITANGQPLATYFYADKKITRPYFAHVFAPGGIQVTRSHPPQRDDDNDHADYHPGIFLAFGDISGHDYWRLKAQVIHDSFEIKPRSTANRGSFTVRNRYQSTDGKTTICIEKCTLTFVAESKSYHILWDSTFSSPNRDFYFGDQEEMGLGVRIASHIREEGGTGRILNSNGQTTAKKTWGQSADWCDYAGKIGGDYVGVTVMAAPYNVRPSWWHNRGYGVFVANMFGRQAMRQGAKSKLEVKRGQTFRLGYGIILHASRDTEPDLAEWYHKYQDSRNTE